MKDFVSSMDDESIDTWLSIMAKESTSLLQKLLTIAKESADLLKEMSKELPAKGLYEAMIFSSQLILRSSDFNRLKDSEVLHKDYITLLSQILQVACLPKMTTKELVDFVLERLDFYQKEWDKMRNNKSYSAMAVYSSFYLTPLTGKKELDGEFMDVLLLQSRLYNIANFINPCIKTAIKASDIKPSERTLADVAYRDNLRPKLQRLEITNMKEHERQMEHWKQLNKMAGGEFKNNRNNRNGGYLRAKEINYEKRNKIMRLFMTILMMIPVVSLFIISLLFFANGSGLMGIIFLGLSIYLGWGVLDKLNE